jgi:large conductance mechanosensitive channel
MWKEFKEFIMKGSIINLAVGFIIGTAFSSIVKSLVDDIIMPPIGLLLNNVNFSELYISLTGEAFASLADAQAAGAPTLNYGLFINAVLYFLIVAFVLFLIIRQANRLKNEPPPPPPSTKECPFCISQISIAASRCPQCTSQLQSD